LSFESIASEICSGKQPGKPRKELFYLSSDGRVLSLIQGEPKFLFLEKVSSGTSLEDSTFENDRWVFNFFSINSGPLSVTVFDKYRELAETFSHVNCETLHR
jgi:hypothetical protein